MFKLGVITDEISPDIEKAVNVSKELKLDCIELRQGWGKNIKDFTDAEIRRVKKIAKSAGLEVICISSPLFKCKIDDEKAVEEHLHFLRRVIGITKFFDANLVRGFDFWATENPEQHWDRVVEKVNEAVDICQTEGVIFALENEHSTFSGTGKEAYELSKAVKSKSLKLLWDPGNAFFAGEKPYPDGYLCVRDQMVHMHIKDAWFDLTSGKNTWVGVGKGEIDYKNQFKALIKDRYDGCISIETHYKIQDDREKATRETCEGIREILKELDLR